MPTLLANRLGANDINCALPGSSNSGIARRTINQLHISKQLPFVAVMWSFPNRYEFRFDYDTNSRESPWRSCTVWDLEADTDKIIKEFRNSDRSIAQHHLNNIRWLQKTGMQKFLQEFYKHVGHTEYWETYNSLTSMIMLQNFLKVNNVPYVFTICDNMIFETYTWKNPDINIVALKDQIDWSRWYLFDDTLGFNQWATKHNYSYGTTHPLHQAHIDAAKLLEKHINEMD